MADSAPRKHFSENSDGTITGVWNIPRPPTRKIPKELAARRKAAISELTAIGNFPNSRIRPSNLHASRQEIDARDPNDPFRKYNWNHRLRTVRGKSVSVPIKLKHTISEIRSEWLQLVYADIRSWEGQRTQAVEQYLKDQNLKYSDTRGNLLLIFFIVGPFAFICTFAIEFFTTESDLPLWIWGTTTLLTICFLVVMLAFPDDGPAEILNKARPVKARKH